jgi:hypothetical protein
VADDRDDEKRSKTQRDKARDFIDLALKRWKRSADAEAEYRKNALADRKFIASTHWPEDIDRIRKEANRPTLTINRLIQPKRQITNQQREARPGIQINPVDGGADVASAEVRQGLIRNIETNSDADVVWGTACNDQVDMGRGWMRIVTEYASADANPNELSEAIFQQEIRLKRIRNMFSVYPDPGCTEFDYSDGKFLFITDHLLWEDYEDKYREVSSLTKASLGDHRAVGDAAPHWLDSEGVTVAEYFYVETVKETIALVEIPPPAGSPEGTPAQRLVIPKPKDVPEGVKVLNERDIMRRQVKWCVINAIEVLEGNDDLTEGRDFPCRWIPVVPVLGDEVIVDGKVDYRGLVRDAKDQNFAYDVQVSSMVELIALTPKSPFMGTVEQFEGLEDIYSTLNVKNYAMLPYKPAMHNGQLLPPPQRLQFEPAIQAVVLAAQHFDGDIKATTGFHDASLGERGPQESGRAIMARQRQGEIGNSLYMDNLGRAMRHVGRILLDMIPRIYDAPRVERILGADDQSKTVGLHAGQSPGAVASLQREGVAQIYDLTSGRHDATISIGASFQSRRQETAEMMTQAISANPSLLPLIGDLYFENVDTPGAKKIAERLKKVLPKELQDEQDGKQPIPPQVQQQMAAAEQQIKQMGEQLQQAKMLIETEAQKLAAQGQIKAMEIQSRERMEQAKIAAELQLAQIHAQAELVKVGQQAQADERLVRVEAALEEMQRRTEFQREAARAQRDEVSGQAKEQREYFREGERFERETARDAPDGNQNTQE